MACKSLGGGEKQTRPNHFLDFSRGGGFLGMRKRALIGCMSHRATGEDERETIQLRSDAVDRRAAARWVVTAAWTHGELLQPSR